MCCILNRISLSYTLFNLRHKNPTFLLDFVESHVLDFAMIRSGYADYCTRIYSPISRELAEAVGLFTFVNVTGVSFYFAE